MSEPTHRFFNCANCPAYCCTYEHIEVTPADLRRLARHFGLSVAKAREKFTKPIEGGAKRVLRHRKDRIFGNACQFLDPKSRRCTIYEARPGICRDYPGTARCGFYDFLMCERQSQEDPKYVPSFRRR